MESQKGLQSHFNGEDNNEDERTIIFKGLFEKMPCF